jgi:uncharacterized membrane protein
MTLKDTMNGSPVLLWIIVVIFAITSIVLLSGHGAGLIAGYYTSSEKEKQKYNEKKLCRVTGLGMSVITVLMLVSALFASVLPAWFAHVSAGIILADCAAIIILSNTVCKK